MSSLCEAGKDADALGKRILLDVVGGGGGLLGYLEVSRHQNVNGGNTTGNGLYYGETHLFFIHLLALIGVSVFAFFGSLVLLKITDMISVLRVSPQAELTGLDLSQHDEEL